MADARKDRRTLLSLKIRYKSATLEDFIERYSMDISGGGVFIKAKKPLAVGTLLKFEFMLQDQSILIHGVGRVVWRREEAEADPENPSGMGIKFIKMDSESRSVVQRIDDERARPGVFDCGKDGVSASSDAATTPPNDGAAATKVRHVSEFLASALEEGGAGEAATRGARAGVDRARRASAGAAVGAFSTSANREHQRSVPDAPGRGAMSAFGGASTSMGGGVRSSAAPAMDEFDDDDFIEETTKVQQLPTSDFPSADADATVISADSPFTAGARNTPVVPAPSEPASRLETLVPDLFGPDSFGPAPGEVIDASLLDPGVATVPPKASALPRGAMPDSPGIPSEAFRVPQAPAPVGTLPPQVEEKTSSRVGLLIALLLLVLVGGGVAAWQLGFLDDVLEAVPAFGVSNDKPVVKAPPRVDVKPEPTPVAEPAAEAKPEASDEAATAEEAEVVADSEAAPSEAGLVKLRVVSVPSGAFVSVDGKGVGRTPLELERKSGAKLALFAKARGFLARRQKVTVDPAQSEVTLVLSSLPYFVEVVTVPPGARASAIGGGEVITPGALKFRSMPSSRKIVISKEGYATSTKSVSRASFVEQKTRMSASVNVALWKEGGSAPAEPAAPTPTAATPEPEAEAASAEPTSAPAADPAPVSEPAPTPSEPAADAP